MRSRTGTQPGRGLAVGEAGGQAARRWEHGAISQLRLNVASAARGFARARWRSRSSSVAGGHGDAPCVITGRHRNVAVRLRAARSPPSTAWDFIGSFLWAIRSQTVGIVTSYGLRSGLVFLHPESVCSDLVLIAYRKQSRGRLKSHRCL